MDWSLNRRLAVFSFYLGTLVVLVGLHDYYVDRTNSIPLYVALAILIVGPIEDLLNMVTNNPLMPEDERQTYIEMINQLSSIAFLLLLGLVLQENKR